MTYQAVAEVVASGRKLAVDRLTLLQHGIVEELRALAARIAQSAMGVLLALSGWIALSIGLGLGLAEVLPAYLAALCLGIFYGAIAFGLVVHAKRRTAQQAEAL